MNSAQIAEQFHRDGFVIMRSVFTEAETVAIRGHLDAYIERVVPRLEPADVYYEDAPQRPIKSLFRMHDHSAFFAGLMHDDRFMHVMRAIWPAGDVIAGGVMFFGKPAQDGSVTPAHQDNAFQCLVPPMGLTATVAVDASTAENGVLTCRAGSHRVGLLPHRQSGVMGFSRCLDAPFDDPAYPAVQLAMNPGDVSLHHIETIHFSGPNRSDRSRRQLGIAYRSSLAHVDMEAQEKYKRDLQVLHRGGK